MREFYHNKSGRNTAIVKCRNQNSVFNLYYHLYDNPVQHIWQNIQKEEYKIFLNTDITWGRMNLGYGTLGKDWIDISKNNDTTDDLALQTTISSETNLVFCVEPGVPGVDEVRFYN